MADCGAKNSKTTKKMFEEEQLSNEDDARLHVVDQQCITWMKGVIQDKLSKDRESVNWSPENQKLVADFLLHKENKNLFVYTSGNQYVMTLHFDNTKKGAWERLLYILKDSSDEVSLDNISSVMAYGILTNELMGDMLNLMKNHFAPDLIEAKNAWPESKFSFGL